MTLPVLTLALLALGCSYEPGYSTSVAIVTDCPELEAAAASAADRIETASGIHVRVNAPGAERRVVLEWGNVAPTYAGLYDPVRSRIDIDVGVSGADVPIVVLHEMMHALGAHHAGPGAGVMVDTRPEHSPAITTVDLKSLCERAPCQWMTPE